LKHIRNLVLFFDQEEDFRNSKVLFDSELTQQLTNYKNKIDSSVDLSNQTKFQENINKRLAVREIASKFNLEVKVSFYFEDLLINSSIDA